jgi:hypothetical protein
VFVGEETLFPVFQIIDSTLTPGSSGLVRALDSPVPHNVFATSMLTPLPYAASRRPRGPAGVESFRSLRHLRLNPENGSGAKFRRELKSPREAFRLKASYSSSESAEDGCYSGASGIPRHGWLYRMAGLLTMEEWE